MTGLSAPILDLTRTQVRRLFLDRQALAGRPAGRVTSASLAELITGLGFVQLDSISTVERAHHMILWSRATGYRPRNLGHLIERQRGLFEHWTHDAAVIPMDLHPLWRVRFERDRKALIGRYRSRFGPEIDREIDRIADHVARNGRVRARDFSEDRVGPAGGWWNWHHGKGALEFLWRTGVLAVAARDGFQKVYDLAERVIPEPVRNAPTPDESTYVDQLCRMALNRLGVASPGDVARFWDGVTIAEAKVWCQGAIDRGEAVPVMVEGDRGAPSRLISTAQASRVDDIGPPADRMRVLSPFDPVIRDRKRLAWLFDYDYRIEIFVPAERRTYGYYVFPLMDGERMVGRIDMATDRQADALIVRRLWSEPKVKWGKGRRDRLDAELDRVRAFVGVERLLWKDGARALPA